jgi:hypothetical protein
VFFLLTVQYLYRYLLLKKLKLCKESQRQRNSYVYFLKPDLVGCIYCQLISRYLGGLARKPLAPMAWRFIGENGKTTILDHF